MTSFGSVESTTEYSLMLARDLGYLSDEMVSPLLSEIGEIARMSYTLRTKVAQRNP